MCPEILLPQQENVDAQSSTFHKSLKSENNSKEHQNPNKFSNSQDKEQYAMV